MDIDPGLEMVGFGGLHVDTKGFDQRLFQDEKTRESIAVFKDVVVADSPDWRYQARGGSEGDP